MPNLLTPARHELADQSVPSDTTTEIVFPPDRRVQINPTTTFPARTVGQIVMTFPNEKTYTGTGVAIGAYYVLTAAHNLWDRDMGGYIKQATFTPARNGAATPWPAVAVSNLSVPEDYRTVAPPSPLLTPGGVVQDVTQYIYDFGLIKLKTPLDVGECQPYAASNKELAGKPVSILGYPGDKPAGTMWGESGPVGTDSEELLFYTIDTYGGQSGAGLMFALANYIGIVGVHVAGSEARKTNFAVRMNADNVATVNSWM